MLNNNSFNGQKVEINYHTSNPALQGLFLFCYLELFHEGGDFIVLHFTTKKAFILCFPADVSKWELELPYALLVFPHPNKWVLQGNHEMKDNPLFYSPFGSCSGSKLLVLCLHPNRVMKDAENTHRLSQAWSCTLVWCCEDVGVSLKPLGQEGSRLALSHWCFSPTAAN